MLNKIYSPGEVHAKLKKAIHVYIGLKKFIKNINLPIFFIVAVFV